MNVDEIRKNCLSFPEATEKLQWGDALCFKVRAKMFAVLGLDQVRLTFKCAPDTFAELIEREHIRPSPYVGRYKWVLVERLDALRNDEVKDLIRQSYEMAEAKATRKTRRRPNHGHRKIGTNLRKSAKRKSGRSSAPKRKP